MTLFSNSMKLLRDCFFEVMAEPVNAYTRHKVDNLVEATVALNNLTVTKNMLERSCAIALDGNLYKD